MTFLFDRTKMCVRESALIILKGVDGRFCIVVPYSQCHPGILNMSAPSHVNILASVLDNEEIGTCSEGNSEIIDAAITPKINAYALE